MAAIHIRQEGDRVLIGKDGALIADMPWQAAEELWRSLRNKTLDAEMFAKREQILSDAHILQEAGAPGNIIGGFVGKPRLLYGGN